MPGAEGPPAVVPVILQVSADGSDERWTLPASNVETTFCHNLTRADFRILSLITQQAIVCLKTSKVPKGVRSFAAARAAAAAAAATQVEVAVAEMEVVVIGGVAAGATASPLPEAVGVVAAVAAMQIAKAAGVVAAVIEGIAAEAAHEGEARWVLVHVPLRAVLRAGAGVPPPLGAFAAGRVPLGAGVRAARLLRN